MHPEGIGPLLRHLRERSGRSRVEQARLIEQTSGKWFDEGNLKRWETERRLPIPAWHELIARVYSVPVTEVQKAVTVSRRTRRLASLSPLLTDPDTDGADDVDRRTFLSVALAAGAATEPWGRLAAALDSPAVDAATVQQLQAATDDMFTTEEHIPARLMYDRLTAHLDTLTALLPHSSAHRRALTIAAGESAALAGWMSWDLGDAQAAQRYYAVANRAGRDAGHGPVCALALGYASYAVAPASAQRMLAVAQEHVRGPGYAVARSWLAAREAEEAAAQGDSDGAVRALERATTALDYAAPGGEQAWTCFFRPSRLGSMRVAAYARLAHPRLAQVTDETLAELGDETAKIRCSVLGDAAIGYLAAGDVDRAVDTGQRALAATLDAETTMGQIRLRHLADQLPEQGDAAELREQIGTLIR